MADKYSVDDILAEVKQRRRQEEGAQLPQPRRRETRPGADLRRARRGPFPDDGDDRRV